MITEEETHLEETGNVQIKAMRQVLNSLRDLAGTDDYPHNFYWFRYVDYVLVDRYGELECWSRGYRGDPDSITSYVLKVDEKLLADKNVDDFKCRFRQSLIPAFNDMRAQKRLNLQRSIVESSQKLKQLEGNIE